MICIGFNIEPCEVDVAVLWDDLFCEGLYVFDLFFHPGVIHLTEPLISGLLSTGRILFLVVSSMGII